MKVTFKIEKDFSAKKVIAIVTDEGIETEEETKEFQKGGFIENVEDYVMSPDKKHVNLKLNDYSTLISVPTQNISPDKFIDDTGGCSGCDKKRKART